MEEQLALSFMQASFSESALKFTGQLVQIPVALRVYINVHESLSLIQAVFAVSGLELFGQASHNPSIVCISVSVQTF